jgi:hypothetical protein
MRLSSCESTAGFNLYSPPPQLLPEGQLRDVYIHGGGVCVDLLAVAYKLTHLRYANFEKPGRSHFI